MAKINILMVDDIQKNLYALEQILNQEGYEILKASSGSECLEILLNQTIHIVLLDIQMPDMDGFEVASFIRNNPKTNKIPIIFITAASQTDHLDLEGYESGAIDIIYKPINQVVLKQKVQTLVEFIRIQQVLEEKVNELTILNEENQKMQEHIERLASIDYLTQTMNRRVLDESYERFYKDAKRNQTPISLLMIDLDNFKDYNDYYGHQKGDEALKIVAKVLKNTIKRPLDTVGRYGGEEFMIILPETDEDGAKLVASKILSNIKKEKVKHAPSINREVLTLSIGIASAVPTKEINKEDLIECADKKLYEAKDAGRDCYK
jgi:diguanylate cyclase (GGDEF)-like protein